MIPLSHSRIETFELCPHKFYRLNVLKDVKPQSNKWSEEGNSIHKSIEVYLKFGTKLPSKLSWLIPILDSFKKTELPFEVERKIALTLSWEEVDYYDSDVFIRSLADFFLINGSKGLLIDWKSGKVKELPIQLQRQACALFCIHTNIQEIRAHFGWLKEKRLGLAYTFTRTELPDYKRDLLASSTTIEKAALDNSWRKFPTRLCLWCPVHVSSGGDCNGN